MSGDHRNTTNYKKELLVDSGCKQFKNTTLFKKNAAFILSPAVAENTQGRYWFDIREAILSYINVSEKSDLTIVFIRIIPDRFIVLKLPELQTIMATHSKVEKTGSKVWSFEIKNKFSVIANKRSPTELLTVKAINESEANDFLQSI